MIRRPKPPRSQLRWRPPAATLPAVLLALGLVLPLPAWAAASGWSEGAHAQVRLITAEQATGSASMVDAGLEIRLAPGWHAYWRDPGAAGIPAAIDWKGSKNVAAAHLEWPAPTRFALDGLQTYGYAGRVVLPIAVRLARAGAPATLHASVAYSACSNICVPYHAVLDLALPAGIALAGPEAPLVAAAHARVPGALGSLGLSLVSATVVPEGKAGAALLVRVATHGEVLAHPDLFVEGLPEGAPGPPLVARAANGETTTLALRHIDGAASALVGRVLRFTLTDGPDRAASFRTTPTLGAEAALPGGVLSLLPVVVAALLGGLILNVMPCIFPVLSLKLLALTRIVGAERREVRHDLLATAAGVLAGFSALAGALIVLKNAGAEIGWGIQFQQPWFLAAMTMVMVLFAADLWGWIGIALPSRLAGFATRAEMRSRRANAFLVGTFATFLATSCTVPFVGTAVGFALSRGAPEILAIFLAMGVGLALPYLIGAAAPALVGLLPRPGRWMLTLRNVFGLLLLATAAWLLSILARLGQPLEAGLVALLAVALIGLLAWAAPRGHAVGAAAAVLIAGSLLVAIVGAEPGARPARMANSGPWQVFQPAAIAENVAQGRTIFVDVTAAWCLICKVNEFTVLDRDPVAARLAAPGVVAMRADWTRPDPAITRYLQSFGRYGVPLDVVYGPGAPDGIVLPDLVEPADVLHAFERAGMPGPVAGR